MAQDFSDQVVARLRTLVPYWWGLFVTWLLSTATWLPEFAADFLNSEAALLFVSGVVGYLWYWLWNKVSPHIPDWLVRIAVGSTRKPTYAPSAKAIARDAGPES